MHIAHIMLIKADSHQDAIDRVRLYLQPDEGQSFADWSDWCIVGEEGALSSRFSFRADYPDWDGASDYAVSSDDEPDLFNKVLRDAYRRRSDAFLHFRQKLQESGKTSILDFGLDEDFSTDAYTLWKFASLVSNDYYIDSYFYDLEHFTASPKSYNAAAEDSGWYAVLVDFHF